MKDKITLLALTLWGCIAIQAQGILEQKMKTGHGCEPSFSYSLTDASSHLVDIEQRVLLTSYDEQSVLCKIIYNEHNGLPRYLKGHLLPQMLFTPEEATAAVRDIINLNHKVFLLKNPDAEWKISLSERKEDGGWKIKITQEYNGIPFYGADARIHIRPDGEMIFMGQYEPTPEGVASQPILTAAEAIQITESDLPKETVYKPFEEAEDKYYPQGQFLSKLVIYRHPHSEDVALVWHITARPNFVKLYEYFINAENGEVFHKYDHTCEIGPTTASATDLNGVNQTIRVWQLSGNSYTMIDGSRPMFTGNISQEPQEGDGIIITLNMQNTPLSNPSYAEVTSTNNNWSSSPRSVSAHNHAGLCYEYYRATHLRNSINGQGGDIVSFINVADDDGGGLDNAFWNGEYMFYGSGAQAFSPLSGSLDVGGHEMTHGVIQSTANLEYQGESGAINESMADCFAVMIDRDDWKLGEDIVNNQFFPTGCLRDMQNPHNGGNSLNDNGWQPADMNEKYTGTQDNGGVHINSGIPNKAFYLLATAISKDKAEKIYYKALDDYLTHSSKFTDLRIAVMEAAGDLYTDTEVNAAASAFDQVGIAGAAGPGNYETEIITNPGTEFIITLDTNTDDPATLYRSTPQGTNYEVITETPVYRRPSITDDGSLLVFVDGSHNLRYVDMTQSNFPESALTSDNFWDNVAISKDGNRLAAVSTQIDTAIYVYDFNLEQWHKFRLYNPTYTSNVNSGGVLYADVLEWDYSGEYVLYDAYNEIPQQGGGSLSYWDMGEMKVWNRAANTFGDGTVQKIFSNLPDGISLGDPSYSKNSPHIIAFDLIDSNNNSFSVMGANLETGANGVIIANNQLGYPSYSKNDDKLAFAKLQNSDKVIATINLNGDKISASGNATTVIPAADWPIWYANGDRPLGIADASINSISATIYPNPASDVSFLTIDLDTAEWVEIVIYDISGKKMRSFVSECMPGIPVSVSTSGLPQGYFLLSIRGQNLQGSMPLLVKRP